MKENKIFLDNFYDKTVAIDLSTGSTRKRVIAGLHSTIEPSEVIKKTVSEVFKALLLHDKVVIPTSELTNIVFAFGMEDSISLLQSGKLELMDDLGYTIVIGENSKNNFGLSNIRPVGANGDYKSSIEWLEEKLIDNKTNNNKDLNILLINAEKHNKIIDFNELDKSLIKEMDYDFSNSHVSKFLNFQSQGLKNIVPQDVYNVLRLAKLNKSLIYSSNLGIENIAIDAKVKPILGIKLSPVIGKAPNFNLYDSFFEEIFQKKGIPDLADLYLKKIVTLNDYLEIITAFNGKKFRHWIADKNYNPIELEKEIISLNPKITNIYLKLIRWAVPNAIGLLGPIQGLIASTVDSFVLEKFMQGWHPNFFLDEDLKQHIDKKIAFHSKEERIADIKRRFPNVGRNDQCPCGSKKKFKKCCGDGI